MARRKEVFQSKVLQRLYPAAPKLEKVPSPPSIVNALAKKTCVKRKASQHDTAIVDARTTQSAADPGRRMYTVLPPPADYKTDSEKPVTLPQLESINSAEDPAELQCSHARTPVCQPPSTGGNTLTITSYNPTSKHPNYPFKAKLHPPDNLLLYLNEMEEESVHDSNEALDQDKEEEEQKRKRRRRKRKPIPCQDGEAPESESRPGQSQTPVDEGGEGLSRNKKRKLKKKRHKEKLLSMGLIHRATALEFTYSKDGEEEEEEEDNARRAAEVSDFLRTTMEIYTSDSSLPVDKLPLLSGPVDDILSGIASGRHPTSVLKQLYSLKAFVQQQETDKLEKALDELHNNSPMSAEETTAVVSLFQYWITGILPMQGHKKTGLSTKHP